MQHMPPPPSPAHPGYYRDVEGSLRWWDGQQWTEVATGEPQQPQQSPPPQQPAKKPDKAKIILLSIGGVIVGLVFLGSCINLLTSGDSTTAAPAPTVTVTATATQTTTENVTEKPKAPEPTKAPKPKPEAETGEGTDGEYLVGSDTKPGTTRRSARTAATERTKMSAARSERSLPARTSMMAPARGDRKKGELFRLRNLDKGRLDDRRFDDCFRLSRAR